MNGIQIEPGFYTNVFEVEVPSEPVDVMIASTSDYPDLRPLREEITRNSWSCRVCRVRDRVFGYGKDCNVLENKSFRSQQLYLKDEPDLCKRLILEGLVDLLRIEGYREWSRTRIGRVKLYEPKPYRSAARGQLQVYRGYDLRSIWWKQESQVHFGIVVDLCWEVQDEEGKRLSTPEIVRFNAMMEIGQIQDEFLTDGKINTEVARLRLQKHILPWVRWVREYNRFTLPCGGEATIITVPVRVVIGA